LPSGRARGNDPAPRQGTETALADRIAHRLQELGIHLPAAQPPVATYLPFVVTGNLVFVSGQLPMVDGALAYAGKLGAGVTLEHGRAAARQCLLNILAHLQVACDGDLDRVARLVRLGGFVACTPDFTQHPAVINGASDLAVEIFGDAGRHARAAVGVPSLPLDAAVEIDAIFEID
jgi:enamine deaminase RidA (YjgF/YER057c/UK114 family)